MDSDELNDIAKLQEVLREAQSNSQTFVFHPLNEQINKVKCTREACSSALASLERVQIKFLEALNEIRKQRSCLMEKMNTLRSSGSTESTSKAPKMSTNPRGPFFTDTELYRPPENIDAIKIKQLGLINMMRTPVASLWSTGDKKKLETIIRNQTIKTRILLAQSKIRALQRDPSSSLNDLSNAKVALERLNNISDEVTVEPLDNSDSYDWDLVSTGLQGRHSAFECQNMWRLLLHPHINKSPWTVSETHKLRIVAEFHNNNNWEAIAADMNTGRSGYQCFVYYKIKVCRNDTVGLRWSPAEDSYLFNVIEHCRVGNHIPWSKVSFFLHNRSNTQIYSRWVQRRLAYEKENLSPKEVAVVKAAFAVYGKQFQRIAEFLPGRRKSHVIQCYHSLFGPETLSNKNWSKDEDDILLKIADNHENPQFNEVHKMLPKKTLDGIKSRYNLLLLEYLGKKEKTNATLCSTESPTPEAVIELQTALKNLREYRKTSIKINHIKKSHNKKEIELDSLDRKIIRFFAENQAPKTIEKPITNINSTVLKSILFLLGSNLSFVNFQCKFLDSNYILKKALQETLNVNIEKKSAPSSGVRTYSRKRPVQEQPDCLDNAIFTGIWSHQSFKNVNLQNYFPPMLDTLTAIRTMSLLKFHQSSIVAKRSRELFHKPCNMKSEFALFMSRFNVLFRWPLLLSCIAPNQHLLSSIDDENKLLSFDDINYLSFSAMNDSNKNSDERNELALKSFVDESNNKAHCSNVSKNSKRKSDTDHCEQKKKIQMSKHDKTSELVTIEDIQWRVC